MKLLVPLGVVVLVVAGWYGGPLVHPTSSPTSARRETRGPVATATGPIALVSQQLRAESHSFAQPIYWAGPATRGYRYEFRRTTSDHAFVRYLPRGVQAGAPGAHFLIVATYPYLRAYKALTKVARGKGSAGPGGSVVFVRPHDPRSVLMAYPGSNYEIEVFDPSPARALEVVRSGLVSAVG